MKNVSKLFAISLFLFTGCKKEDVSTGFSEKVNNVIPQKTIEQIKTLGSIEINEGKNPPSLDGYFSPSPYALIAEKNSGSQIGAIHTEYIYKFYDYDSKAESLKISYKTKTGSTIEGQGQAGVVSGSGGKFTVFAKTINSGNNYYEIFSGELTSAGIKNWVDGIFKVDTDTDKITYFKILKDTDALTEKVNGQSFRMSVKGEDNSQLTRGKNVK